MVTRNVFPLFESFHVRYMQNFFPHFCFQCYSSPRNFTCNLKGFKETNSNFPENIERLIKKLRFSDVFREDKVELIPIYSFNLKI